MMAAKRDKGRDDGNEGSKRKRADQRVDIAGVLYIQIPCLQGANRSSKQQYDMLIFPGQFVMVSWGAKYKVDYPVEVSYYTHRVYYMHRVFSLTSLMHRVFSLTSLSSCFFLFYFLWLIRPALPTRFDIAYDIAYGMVCLWCR
jgi:hypothetical protein